MNAYILDSSVAAKWFLPPAGETLVDESLAVLDQFTDGRLRLFVPDVFWTEVAGILWKAARAGRMSDASAEDAIICLSHAGIPSIETAPLLRNALPIALHFDRTIHDAIYVAIAVTSGRPLVTADERLANALAAYFPVRWLGGHWASQ